MNIKISILLAVVFSLNSLSMAERTEPVIIDHTCTDITLIPESTILQAKESLHVAYAHTSHGSQIISGMNGLIDFANSGGKRLLLPVDIFAWNNGGFNGSLDLHDYAMNGDVGYYPDWVNNTQTYLNDSQNTDVNVVMWSWCGQVSGKYSNDTLLSEYIIPMSQLEIDYPDVTFIYMTGHVDHWEDANNKAANQIIRDYCEANNKVLYDFADIESHDPNGTYFPFSHDNCDYYASKNGELLGNWAQEWQGSHTKGADWYQCESAHSQPLNANQKAYAAWWLFAKLAGWSGAESQYYIADLNYDGIVDEIDLSLFCYGWLEANGQ
ncbi:MAG: hypothetical protein JXB49_10155 [Bacteroidales bacterium]|nr:hypothetical protein [Bacteroidales bacterium]